MASEKGATYLDRLCHKFYDEPKGHGNKTDYVCRLCGGQLETYYCEERLYLVKCADCGTFSLVKTANPEDAARVTLARPPLTPPNEPLTLISMSDEIPPDNERVLVYRPCMVDSDTGPYSVQWGWAAKRDGSHWARLPDRRPPEGEA